MAVPKKLGLPELREIVHDGAELAKGAKFFDDGLLLHPSRFEHKLFAEAKGSGSAPYKVQITFEEKGVRGRCSCMAARSRPFCKHAAGLLVAWARAPESFAEADAGPAGMGDATKKEVKKGKVETKELMGRGVERVSTLVRELAVSGVAALAGDRVEQVHALGAALRESKLRRLSARTIELSSHLERAAARADEFSATEYAELLGDILLTSRKIEKHLAGEAIQEEHVEELIGKTWTKKDRKPIAGLELVEYAFLTQTTSDEFVIRESRFFDLSSGDHYSEKQIIPAFLAKRTDPKPSHAGKVLAGAAGSLYPSFSPRRVDLESAGDARPLDPEALGRLLDRALPQVSAALSALQDRRKDIFAPESLPVALRGDTVLADGARLRLVDAQGAALFLPDFEEVEEALARTLRDTRLRALLGDVALDGALPTLFPLAAVVESGGELELLPLARLDAARIIASRKIRAEALEKGKKSKSRWVDVARAVGASSAAIALGEVREEMADALANGLATVVPRVTDPLVSRLRDLGLGKQADLLASVSSRADPSEKLDDFVKLHQVLGIALARLAGASHVDRATIEPVPSYESVFVKKPERTLEPKEVAALSGSGRMNRYEAAAHYARHYASLPSELLASAIYPTWADGSASPYVAAALAKSPTPAIAAAKKVLLEGGRFSARVAKLTAIRVLGTIGSEEARAILSSYAKTQKVDPAIAAHAERALGGGQHLEPRRRELQRLSSEALNASVREDRMKALSLLARGGLVEATPILRASFFGDVSADVRARAGEALAELGDVESVDTFLRMLRNRGADDDGAKTAARALGVLGDVRGIDELLRAWAEGWHPAIVADALKAIGPAALEPIVALLESRPELADRKAVQTVIAGLPKEEVNELFSSRLAGLADAEFCARASLYLTIASGNEETVKAWVRRLVELRPSLLDPKKAAGEEKALAKKCAKHLAKA
jgi:HEAT repeat protein